MISIILPVYDTLELLPDAVGSVLGQTCPDWELILVDDGSTDGSGDLCDRYASGDDRIRVIHQENRGLSGARNAGLAIAAGEWLQFLDSDDWLSPDALETLLRTAEETGAGVVLFDALYEFPDRSWHERPGLAPGVYGPRVILEKLAALAIPPYAWNKFCRRSLFEGVLFPVGECWEDVPTMIWPISRAGKIAVLDAPMYHYRQRQEAITKRALRDRSIYRWRFLQYGKRYDFLAAHCPEAAPAARPSLIESGVQYYAFCLRGREQGEERRRVVRYLRQTEMGQSLPNAKARLARLAFCACPGLTALLLRGRDALRRRKASR